MGARARRPLRRERPRRRARGVPRRDLRARRPAKRPGEAGSHGPVTPFARRAQSLEGGLFTPVVIGCSSPARSFRHSTLDRRDASLTDASLRPARASRDQGARGATAARGARTATARNASRVAHALRVHPRRGLSARVRARDDARTGDTEDVARRVELRSRESGEVRYRPHIPSRQRYLLFH